MQRPIIRVNEKFIICRPPEKVLKYIKFNLYMYYLRILLTIINLGLFGVGSFLCFIVAVSQSLDRLLIGGIFLLLLTFANQKIISNFSSK